MFKSDVELNNGQKQESGYSLPRGIEYPFALYNLIDGKTYIKRGDYTIMRAKSK